MTRARARALHEKVNSLLVTLDLGTSLDGILLTADTLCVIRYLPQEPSPATPDDEMLTGPQGEKGDDAPRPVPLLDLDGTTASDAATSSLLLDSESPACEDPAVLLLRDPPVLPLRDPAVLPLRGPAVLPLEENPENLSDKSTANSGTTAPARYYRPSGTTAA